jgi:hypothetical protein
MAFTGNRPAAARARAAAIFFGLDLLDSLLEDLDLQRLLAEQAMQLANLLLQRPVLRGRDYFLARGGRRVGPLGHQAAPGEELVRVHPVLPGHQAHRGVRRVGLLDHADLLSRRPSPAALDGGDDLHLG